MTSTMSHDSAVSVLPFHGPRRGFLLSPHMDASEVFFPADSRDFDDRELMDVCSFICSADELKACLQSQDLIQESNRDSTGDGEFEAILLHEARHGGERGRNLLPYIPQAMEQKEANAVGHGQRDDRSPYKPLFNTLEKPGNSTIVEESKAYQSQGDKNTSSGSDVWHGFSQNSPKPEPVKSHSQGIRESRQSQGFENSTDFTDIERSTNTHDRYAFNENLHAQSLDPVISHGQGVGGLAGQNSSHGSCMKLHVQNSESLTSHSQGLFITADLDASNGFSDKLHAENSESLITHAQCFERRTEVNASHGLIDKLHAQDHVSSENACSGESRIFIETEESNIYHHSKVEHKETQNLCKEFISGNGHNVAEKTSSHRHSCHYHKTKCEGKEHPVLPSIKINPKTIPKPNKGNHGRLRKYHSLSSTSDLMREEAWERKKVLYHDNPATITSSSPQYRPVTRSVSDCGNMASWGEQTTPSSSRSRIRSLTDADLEELRGCIDLGFGFTRSSGEDLDLKNTLPALELYLAINRQYDDIKSRASPISSLNGSVLSRSSSGDSSSHSSPLNDPLRMSSPGDHPSRVKTRLRHWAQAVACSIKEGFSL